MFRKEWGFDSLHGHQPSLATRSEGWPASLGEGGGEAAASYGGKPLLSKQGNATEAMRFYFVLQIKPTSA